MGIQRVSGAEGLAGLDAIAGALDLEKGRLGAELIDLAVAGMRANLAAGLDPDGGRLPELSPEYAARKAITHPGAGILVRDGLLSSAPEMDGTRSYAPASAEYVYGISDPARAEMDFAAEGGRGRPPRLVVGITAEAKDAIGDRLDREFDLGGGII